MFFYWRTMCSAAAERDVWLCQVMFASQVMCANARERGGTHLITATAGSNITFAACGKYITCAEGAIITLQHLSKTHRTVPCVPGMEGFPKSLRTDECMITLTDTPMGMRTSEGAVYTEISIKRNDTMNEAIKAGEIFKLADLVPYVDGKIVNMDVVHNEKMKFVVMAFDEGTGLSEHAAPGEALIFALDGEGMIGYNGIEHSIKAGENFRFAKAGLHSVKANKRFKMALLLTLE